MCGWRLRVVRGSEAFIEDIGYYSNGIKKKSPVESKKNFAKSPYPITSIDLNLEYVRN